MAKAATLNIDIVAKADQAISAFEKVKEKATSSHAMMKTAAVVASAAILGALGEATKAAAEHEVSVAKLAQTYRNAGQPMGDMKTSLDDIETSSRRTGQSTEDNIAGYTDLVAATRSTTKAHQELAIAQDLAAFKGISVKEAADDITRAAGGNTRALKEMGIQTKDAGGHALSAAALMDSLSKAVHGQADAMGDTTVGKMNRYKESMDQLKEKVGEALIPVLQQLMNLIQPLVDWMTRHAAVVKVLALVLGGLAAVVETVILVQKAWNAMLAVTNALMDANPIGLIILALAALAVGVYEAYKHFKPFHDIINDVWSALKTVGDWIFAHWRLIVGALLGPLGFLILNFGFVKNLLGDIIGALKDVGRAVSDALGWLGKLPSKASGLLGKVTGGIGSILSVPGGGGPVATPVNITVYATPGDDLPDVVYQALRNYQRRHARPELRILFGG
jgi:hypothetical protein